MVDEISGLFLGFHACSEGEGTSFSNNKYQKYNKLFPFTKSSIDKVKAVGVFVIQVRVVEFASQCSALFDEGFVSLHL